jgi:hypothetical protein
MQTILFYIYKRISILSTLVKSKAGMFIGSEENAKSGSLSLTVDYSFFVQSTNK